MKTLILLLLTSILNYNSYAQVSMGKVGEIDEYKIEDKLVTKIVYEKLQSTLKQVDGTYSCKKTAAGGMLHYEARDSKNNNYIVSINQDGKTSYYHIFKYGIQPKNIRSTKKTSSD